MPGAHAQRQRASVTALLQPVGRLDAGSAAAAVRAANRVLVDYHHRLPLSSVWGYGGFSSCDGQRWGVQQGSLHAALYPRYFGYYERAINVLTHISDQHSVFATRAIACGPREALYVLDGLLENDTVLKPREHTTDTHGITEQLF
ncbi:MAG: Tn3 family transposase, partial [Myxococcales bacterium]|nr:Tn3 family transposase [Myxococcales bacterium]